MLAAIDSTNKQTNKHYKSILFDATKKYKLENEHRLIKGITLCFFI